MRRPELWTIRAGRDSVAQMGAAFPLLLMAFRLRLLEHLVLYGVFWVAEALSWGPTGLVVGGGAAAAAGTAAGGVAAGGTAASAAGDHGLAVGWTVAVAGCLVLSGVLTQLDKRRFLAVWRREHARSRERLRMREEIEYARKIQLSMLPQAPPDIGWLDLSAASLPATEVGGDYYDTFRLAPSRLVLVIADVSGHGLASGLLLSGVRSCLYLLEADLASPQALGPLDPMVP